MRTGMRESWPHAPPHYFTAHGTYLITRLRQGYGVAGPPSQAVRSAINYQLLAISFSLCHGLGAGVGRGRADGSDLGVAVEPGVGVGVGVPLGVCVGVGPPDGNTRTK